MNMAMINTGDNNMYLCIAGKNNIAVEILDYAMSIFDKGKILGVPNCTDIGEDGWQKSFLKKCCDEGIECAHIHQLYNMDMVFLSLEYNELIYPSKFKSKNLFNIHFSALPKFRGMYTSTWPILKGEKESGVTLHKIDNGIDTGDIIDQILFPIKNEDTARDLYFKYIKYGTMLVKENLINLLEGNFITYPQSVKGATYYAKGSIKFNEINFRQTADAVVNQIRAFTFKEYQLPKINDRIIEKAVILDERSQKRPMNILEESEKYIIMSTIDYNIKLIMGQKNGA
jgi:methionyl-tRNA formyltransferase